MNNSTRNSVSRRRFAVLSGGAVTTAALAACGGSDDEATSGSADGTLTFLNQSRGQEAALTALAKTYTEQTGVKVTIDTPGPTDFSAKLQSMAQADKMPDLFSFVDANAMAPYLKAGWAMDLSTALEGDWGGQLDPQSVELATYQDGNRLGIPAGVYSAHWDLSTFGLYVDPTATAIDPTNPPATVHDLTTALQAAGDAGRFSIAASLVPYLLQSYASNYMTDDEIEATMTGEADWNTDAWRSTFQILTDLRDAGVIANSSLPGGSDDNPSVEKAMFNSHTVGAIFDATAAVAVARATAPDYTTYATMPVPGATDGTEPSRAVLRVGKGAAVNPKSDNADAALEFLQWLTAADQQKVFATEVGVIPTNTELLAAGEVLPQMTGFLASVATAQSVQASFTSDVVAAIGSGAQSIVLGEKTVDQVLTDVQTAQDQSA